MEKLYPSFDLPEEIEEEQIFDEDLVTVHFDFESLDVQIDANGKVRTLTGFDAYKQWVIKCVLTERYKYLAYDTDFGVEIEGTMAADYTREVAIMEIKRSITEALLVDERTVSVTDVNVRWEGDNFFFEFEVESVFGIDSFSVGGVQSGTGVSA